VTGDSEPVSVLKIETCSATFEVALNETVSVLKIEECLTRTEDRPNEAERLLAKLFI
jgi:hypothetical protein